VQDRIWIIDPVDGTHEFVAGNHDWGTNVALQVDGEITLGVVSRPLLGETWWAVRGGGAYRENAAGITPLRVSMREQVSQCTVTGWPEDEASGFLDRLRAKFAWTPARMDVVPRLLIGEIQAVIGLRAGPWDFAPAVVLVEEAGGSFVDLNGGRSIYGGAAILTNGRVNAHIRAEITG
jgi:histidinol-phosphatase